MLPDAWREWDVRPKVASQCTYRCVVLPDCTRKNCYQSRQLSQCTYRCVVLPDKISDKLVAEVKVVSMHLQVRGAP